MAEASLSTKPFARYARRSTSPTRQMPPPTKNDHRQSFPSLEWGLARRFISSYSRGVIFMANFSFFKWSFR